MDAIAETRLQLTSLLSWAIFLVAIVPGGFLGYRLRLNGLWLSVGLLAVSFLLPFPTAEIGAIAHRGFSGLAIASFLGYLAASRKPEESES